MQKSRMFLVVLAVQLIFCCCTKSKDKGANSMHFTSLSAGETGITFNNTISENDSVNLIENEYAYMGGGVAVGDFNNDNLPDVFFSANQKSSRLYINKGNFAFEDVTKKANVESDVWATGVSVVDINNDGFDDIYMCVSGSRNPFQRRNKLYINNGNVTFTESAAAYGLADTNYSTQAVFTDFDKDGDLDMYLLNHLLYQTNANTIVKPDFSGTSPANDKLYLNEGIARGSNHPLFKDVTLSAGIKESGYGLGVVVSDFNNDNWPDIYVANDYVVNDVLWINNRNGTFSNRIATSINHTSYSSMGVDAADINNDNLPDIATLDMLPEDNERKKMMFSFMTNDRYEMEHRSGYTPSFMRNMLQLNNGTRNVNDTSEPYFSEIGQLSGLYQTDWSWSVLMADFDNDGWKDVHITNGMGKDMLNSDYLFFRNDFATKGEFSNIAERNRVVVNKLNEYGAVELNNYLFHNNGDYTFSNVSADAGINSPSISNGCAYADFDNDGDLDLMVNNINKEAFVLRNDVKQNKEDSIHNYLSIRLVGDSLNKDGFGAKVTVYTGQKTQFAEESPVRGFISTVDKLLHFGLANAAVVDSVTVAWPNDKQQTIKNIPVNQVFTVQQKEASQNVMIKQQENNELFTEVSNEYNIDFRHKEAFFYDYSFQQLLPQKYSQLGPFITQGDINADGLSDFFVGGAYQQSGRFYIQQGDGRFISTELVSGEKEEEDLGCLLFDADGDKDLDLFVNSGGYEFDAGSPNYKPRLYLNDGKGNFSLDIEAISKTVSTSAQAVSCTDYDMDGDMDLFIGGRVSPNQYPVSPRSYILQNSQGRFTDVTADVCPTLQEPGMVTSAVWTDFNGDRKPDLVIAGEWMPIRFFENKSGQLVEATASTGLQNMSGQWRSLVAADLDKDGDVDFVAGNLGLNNRYKASAKEPIVLYAKDLDGNGSIDPIMAYYMLDGKGNRNLFPSIGREQFAGQVPSIKTRYLHHADYSKHTMEEILSPENKEDLLKLTCEETRTGWIENKGKGTFLFHPLPAMAQFAPVNAIVCTDANSDGNPDIVIAGNEYQAEVMTGLYDASYGLLLQGDGKGNFIPVSPAKSGIIINGDVKDMKEVTSAGSGKIIMAAVNDNRLKAFKLK